MEGRSRVIENNKNRTRRGPDEDVDRDPRRSFEIRGGMEVSSISDTVGGQQVGKRLTPFSSRLSLA